MGTPGVGVLSALQEVLERFVTIELSGTYCRSVMSYMSGNMVLWLTMAHHAIICHVQGSNGD